MSENHQRNRHRYRGGNGENKPRSGRGFGNHEQESSMPKIRVALAGNPNAGKTSLFNSLTGQHQHIGNYPGVTVDKKSGYVIHKGWKIELVDLPGTYSLSAYSLEEVVTRDFVLTEKPDLIVDVIDSTNLERNLYLCLQFQELGVPIVGALNMTDEVEADGSYIDEIQLSSILGIPFVKTVGSRGQGNEKLLDLIISIANNELESSGRIVNYGREIEAERSKLIELLQSDKKFAENYAVAWIAVKLLEEDEDAIEKVKNYHPLAQLILRRAEESRNGLYRHFHEDSVVIVSEQRYAYIHGAVKETLKQPLGSGRIPFTEYVDRIILNRYAGVFIFFFVMFMVYQLTFSIGNPLSDLLDSAFSKFGAMISTIMPDGVLQDLIVDGIIGGVGGVLVFFPIVMLLFLGLSILEDSGYMARAA
ncbi:ferrous iron transport protein B, partial [bacterium]|nr:ferrous iron transport protein B [bacterium]